MPDSKDLIQGKFAKDAKVENPDPEYQRLLNAYVANPFDDMHLRPEEKEKLEKESSTSLPSAE